MSMIPGANFLQGGCIMSFKQVLATLISTLAFMFVASICVAAEMPDQVSLDSMSEMFEAAEFDHTMHTELGEDCSVCHHHTTGTGTTDERCVSCHGDSDAVAAVGCSDCHIADPFSAEQINQKSATIYKFHIDRPGLKAAYHWNCLGCHEVMDGPTGCQDCHARTPAGDAFYHQDASGDSEASGH
jgi:hypothetical protein